MALFKKKAVTVEEVEEVVSQFKCDNCEDSGERCYKCSL